MTHFNIYLKVDNSLLDFAVMAQSVRRRIDHLGVGKVEVRYTNSGKLAKPKHYGRGPSRQVQEKVIGQRVNTVLHPPRAEKRPDRKRDKRANSVILRLRMQGAGGGSSSKQTTNTKKAARQARKAANRKGKKKSS